MRRCSKMIKPACGFPALTICRTQGFGLVQRGISLNIAYRRHALSEDTAKIPPPQMLDQRLVIVDDGLKIVILLALRGHQQSALLTGNPVIGIALRCGEKPVQGAFELAADGPKVHRRGEYHHIRLTVHRINLIHGVLLHARTV